MATLLMCQLRFETKFPPFKLHSFLLAAAELASHRRHRYHAEGPVTHTFDHSLNHQSFPLLGRTSCLVTSLTSIRSSRLPRFRLSLQQCCSRCELRSHRVVENANECMLLDSEVLHGFCFRTLKWTTPTSNLSLTCQLCCNAKLPPSKSAVRYRGKVPLAHLIGRTLDSHP